MYTITSDNQMPLGLQRLTGSNRGLFYTNEQQVTTTDADGNDVTRFQYDVYPVSDARFPHAVKDEVIVQRFPYNRERKILRQTLAKLLERMNLSDDADFSDFASYHEFVESL